MANLNKLIVINARIINGLLPLGIVLLFSVYSPQKSATAIYVYSLAQIFSMVLRAGADISLPKLFEQDKFSNKNQSKIILGAFIFQVCKWGLFLVIVFTAIYCLGYDFVGRILIPALVMAVLLTIYAGLGLFELSKDNKLRFVVFYHLFPNLLIVLVGLATNLSLVAIISGLWLSLIVSFLYLIFENCEFNMHGKQIFIAKAVGFRVKLTNFYVCSAQLANSGFSWLLPVSVGLILGPMELIEFSKAVRISAIVGFVQYLLQPFAIKKFAFYIETFDYESLKKIYNRYLVVSFLAAVFTTVVLLTLSGVMENFKFDFTMPAGNILAILCLGQVINCAVGPVIQLLQLNEKSKSVMNICIISSTLLLIFLLLASKLFGNLNLIQISIASSVAMAISNIAMLYVLKKSEFFK